MKGYRETSKGNSILPFTWSMSNPDSRRYSIIIIQMWLTNCAQAYIEMVFLLILRYCRLAFLVYRNTRTTIEPRSENFNPDIVTFSRLVKFSTYTNWFVIRISREIFSLLMQLLCIIIFPLISFFGNDVLPFVLVIHTCFLHKMYYDHRKVGANWLSRLFYFIFFSLF